MTPKRPREYEAWAKMKARMKPTYHAYHRYGGRGITVCDRWQEFVNFYEDMGSCPPGLTLERIDNDKGYEPGNCCWAPWAVQQRNKGYARKVKRSDGKTYTHIVDAAADVGGDNGKITMVCQGKRKTHAGFGWQYMEVYP